MVQGRPHLRGARPRVPGLERRRHRRLPRPDLAARLHRRARRHRDLAAAVLPLPAARRRLRHGRLPHRQPGLRDAARLPRVPARGARARPARDHRARAEPHLGPAPVVPARPPRAARLEGARLLRVERHAGQVSRRADHLQGLRDLELDVGHRRGRLLLAPLLLAPARPQLRQPRGAEGALPDRRLLARDGRRRAAARRGAVPVRARGHELREPPRDAPRAARAARAHRRALRRPHAARRGEPVARGRRRLLRRRRRVPHGVPLPRDAAHVHGDPRRRTASRSSTSSARRRRSPRARSGRSSCATTTS